jgi:hypothetical protein
MSASPQKRQNNFGVAVAVAPFWAQAEKFSITDDDKH